MNAVDDWLQYLEQANVSPRTIKSYRSTFAAFPMDPLTASIDDIKKWWDELYDKPNPDDKPDSVPTRQRKLHTLRSFYKYAIAFDLTDKDPTRRIRSPKQGRRLPEPISREDLHRVLDAAEPDVRRAVALGAYAGMRVSEVAELEWSNVDLERRRIRVRGKGDKDRDVALGPLLLDSLLPITGSNVVTGTDSAYSADQLQRRVNRLLARLGIKATFHKFRARYATVGLAGSGNLLAVSRALGHVSPATTALYALTADADLDQISSAVER